MQLIKIENSTIGEEIKETVNARELHAFLEVGKDFSTWIKDRIEQYGFTESQDFVIAEVLSSPESGSTKARPQKLKEYHVSLDMAKELSMVERNEKGKQARQYFIECERQAKNPLAALNDPAAMRSLLLSYSEKVIQRDKLIAEMQPKALVADRLAGADGNFCIRNAAKLLKVKETALIAFLLIKKWLFRNKSNRLEGYATHVPKYVQHKTHIVEIDGEADKICLQVTITPKGLTRLAELLNVELEAA